MTPTVKHLRTPPAAEAMTARLVLGGLLWLLSLLLLGLVHVAGAASYDELPGWLLLLELSWALVQGLSLLRLIYCL